MLTITISDIHSQMKKDAKLKKIQDTKMLLTT